MGITSNHALGREGGFFAALETTPGTAEAVFAAANAMGHLPAATSFDDGIERVDDDEARTTRSVIERTTGKEAVAWQMAHYVRPSGAAGTAPDCDVLWESAFGTKVVNPGVSVVYSLSDAQQIKSLTLGLEETYSSELAAGAYVNQLTLSGQGGDKPQIQYQGGALSYIFTGSATVTVVAATTFEVSAADLAFCRVGSRLEFVNSSGSVNDNAGAGYLVTSISGSTITVDATHGATVGDAVRPLTPSRTKTGEALPGIAGSLTVNSVTRRVVRYSVTIDNQVAEVNDEAFTAGSSDASPGYRVVSGEFEFRAREDVLALFGSRRDFNLVPAVLTIGTVTGRILELSFAALEFEFSAMARSGDDTNRFVLPFRAHSTGGANEVAAAWR